MDRRLDADLAFLRSKKRPSYERFHERIGVVDLFCGCGGMTLGVAEAARQRGYSTSVRLAIDLDGVAAEVYAENFRDARVESSSVEEWFPGGLGKRLRSREKATREEVGRVDILVAGPPCQGHSDLNNHTRRQDGRNALYARVARAAEVLDPGVVIIENVPAVCHDRGDVVGATREALAAVGYTVDDGVISLLGLGVPQTRDRHFLFAHRGSGRRDVLGQLPKDLRDGRTVRWAIADLVNSRNGTAMNMPTRLSSENRERIAWLFEQDAYDLPDSLRPSCHRDRPHTYRSMYGRLHWDRPAQTITTGFTSMGQGRYVHPSQPRTITPHEAARLQTFPDFYDFAAASGRTRLARLIGNAVPPIASLHLAHLAIDHLLEHQDLGRHPHEPVILDG